MIVVSGKTFPHRETLKDMGGRFDGNRKVWKFDRLSDRMRSDLESIIGIVVSDAVEDSDDDDTSPPVRRPNVVLPNDMVMRDHVRVFGSDERFLNYFRDKKPLAHFGFYSLSEMVRFIESAPSYVYDSSADERNWGWKKSSVHSKWTGTENMKEALRLSRDGWREGVQKAREISEIFTLDHAQRKQRFHSVAGGSVNIGRMLSGNPAHMRKRPKRDGSKIVTLFVETFMSAGISPDNAIIRAALVAAIVEMLEMREYSCEIIAVCTTSKYGGAATGQQTTVSLKNAGEKLNLDDIMFSLGHPSFFRRFIFACVGISEECRDIWRSQGSPAAAFNKRHPTKKNEFYITQLNLGEQSLVVGRSLIEKARSMLPLIVKPGSTLAQIMEM